MSEIQLPAGFERCRPARAALPDSELEAAFEVAQRACDRAREEILPRYRRVAVETKSDGSPVTEADLAAEKAIREEIRAAFPEDSILGEEFGDESAGHESESPRRRWVVDPIDGTIAFSRGIPLFTTLISLLVDDEPVLGVIDLPAVGDRIAGMQRRGLWRGNDRLNVSQAENLEEALICHGDLFCFEQAGLRPLYDTLSRRVQKLRGYTDAFGHLLVLSGAADAMVDCDLNPWDAAATRILTLEAGGECWMRRRRSENRTQEGTGAGEKLDLIFGGAKLVQAIGNCAATDPA